MKQMRQMKRCPSKISEDNLIQGTILLFVNEKLYFICVVFCFSSSSSLLPSTSTSTSLSSLSLLKFRKYKIKIVVPTSED